jgi:tellurium resistance protein TerZ
MTVSLTKGQTVNLTKSGGGALSRVRMGLGWDAIKKRGMFGGSKQVSVDLDASALLFTAAGQVVDIVYFGQLQSKDGSITHTGDNRTGAGEGDDESILVELPQVPADVAHIVFVVNSYSGQNFSQIENAFARAVDSADGDRELVRYELSGSGNHSAVVMARLSRSGAGWTFTAVGTPGEGRTANQLVPLVAGTL